MRLDYLNDGSIRVTLSRRNVVALLAKLDEGGSLREIMGGDAYADSGPIDETYLLLHSFEDAARDDGGQVVVAHVPPQPFFPYARSVLAVDISRSALLIMVSAVDEPEATRSVRAGRIDLRVEHDDEHYARRPEPPGTLTLTTEDAIARSTATERPLSPASDAMTSLRFVLPAAG